MALTTSRPWPPPSTADRARRSVGERLPRLSTSCCDPVRLVLRRPIESGLHPAIAVVDQALLGPAALQGHHQGVCAELALRWSAMLQPTTSRVARSSTTAR